MLEVRVKAKNYLVSGTAGPVSRDQGIETIGPRYYCSREGAWAFRPLSGEVSETSPS